MVGFPPIPPYLTPSSLNFISFLQVLGKGSFGKVMLVRFKGSRELYAMKTLRKEALIRRSQLAHTSTERYILQHIHHPFLMRLSYAFQTKQKLYMVVDYMAGGELFFWLKKGKFGQTRAKLYAAEILCALEALHKHNVVYRDLKPENILLDADGHIRLTDFGLCKANVTGYGVDGGAHTFCGTPEYLAPEVLENKGHGKGIDWWSLGTLLYEMICGLPPFYDQNVQKMYKKIMTAPLNPSKLLSEDAKAIIQGLLERKVAHRLGCGPAGAAEIKNHPFFAGLDWDKVTNRKYQPEFVPPRARRRSVDVDNFDKEFTQEVCQDSVVQTILTAQQEEMANFEGFTYDPRGARLRLRTQKRTCQRDMDRDVMRIIKGERKRKEEKTEKEIRSGP
ncbi:protein kinase 2 [Nannochloropsis gaditana]|uniref:Protein kinase 2 n=1 Tax=Nannochloropsis gaditana TaxID=72520 RepID=W7T5L1_9STRA|nr:protein kinase 2 [Nannochloropsis gaditana]